MVPFVEPWHDPHCAWKPLTARLCVSFLRPGLVPRLPINLGPDQGLKEMLGTPSISSDVAARCVDIFISLLLLPTQKSLPYRKQTDWFTLGKALIKYDNLHSLITFVSFLSIQNHTPLDRIGLILLSQSLFNNVVKIYHIGSISQGNGW